MNTVGNTRPIHEILRIWVTALDGTRRVAPRPATGPVPARREAAPERN